MKNKETVFWIFRRFKRFLPAVVLLSVLSTAVSLSSIVLILITREILDGAQFGTAGDEILKNIVLLLSVLVIQLVANTLNGLLKHKTAYKMDMYIKQLLFSSLIGKEYKEITSLHSGEMVNRFTSDVDVVVNGFASIIPAAISLIVKLIAGIAVVVFLEPAVAVFVVIIGFVFPLMGRMINKRYKYLHKEVQRTDGVVRSFIQESVQNMTVIKTFAAKNSVAGKLDCYLSDNFFVKVKRAVLSVLMHSGLYGSFTLGYYGVIIWGALGIANGTLTYGTFIAFLQLVSQLRNPLQNISGLLPAYYSAVASAERLIELENLEDETIDPSVDTDKIYCELRSLDASGLCFGYDARMVIKNADFSLKKGSVCAVMGESGKGKSTLFRLLLGLYRPTDGSLSLKTEQGDIPVTSAVRGLFSYVPQGVMVLSGTIRENITFLSGNVTDEQLERAAKQAVIYDFIMSLPKGFDTPIGERGLGLSEGQLQRIAIARALLLDAPIMLLDECTSALDEETELKLLENLKKESEKTVILITHRRAVLDICDSLLEVSDGNIELKKM